MICICLVFPFHDLGSSVLDLYLFPLIYRISYCMVGCQFRSVLIRSETVCRNIGHSDKSSKYLYKYLDFSNIPADFQEYPCGFQ